MSSTGIATEPRWLADLVSRHGQPLAQPETVDWSRPLGVWAWPGIGVRIEQASTRRWVSHVFRGQTEVDLRSLKPPTDQDLWALCLRVGLLGDPTEAVNG